MNFLYKHKTTTVKSILLVSGAVMLMSCAATQTVLEHGSLQVNTRLSDPIYLEDVSTKQKTVFISIKNTTDEDVSISSPLKTALSAKGYKVVSSPDSAHYKVQATVLQIGKMKLSASQSALDGGVGSAITGAVAGTALGALSGNTSGMIAGGVVGGVVGVAADALIKPVNITMITDVRISERVGKGVQVKEQFKANLASGASSSTQQTYSKTSQFQTYSTRIVSNADKVNLKFSEARPALEQGLVKSISGIF